MIRLYVTFLCGCQWDWEPYRTPDDDSWQKAKNECGGAHMLLDTMVCPLCTANDWQPGQIKTWYADGGLPGDQLQVAGGRKKIKYCHACKESESK